MAGFFKTDPKPKRTKKTKTAKDITLDDLIAELDSARLVAGTNGNATAMISATMAKAKLCGLDKGKIDRFDDVPVGLDFFYGRYGIDDEKDTVS